MAITINQAREAIYQRFAAAWADRTPYAFENEDFDPVEAVWTRLAVRHADRNQISLGQPGTRKFETRGIVFQQLFIPMGAAMGDLDAHLEFAKGIFDAARIEGTTIRFFAAKVREIGPGPDSKYFGSTVETGFTYEAQG